MASTEESGGNWSSDLEMDWCHLFSEYDMHRHSLEEENSLQPAPQSHYTPSNFNTESISLLTSNTTEGIYGFDNSGYKQDGSSQKSPFSSSYILSFENSTAVPNIPRKTYQNHGAQLKETQEEQDNRKSNIVGRSSSMTHVQHMMAERRRRANLSKMFITLSALIPGLKKMDKVSILYDAINHIKHLQKCVKELEEQNKTRRMEARIYFNNNKSDVAVANDFSCISDGFCKAIIKRFPNVEVRVSGKDVLIRVMCEKQKDIASKLLTKLEANHLSIVCSSVLPFENSTVDITIIAQVDHEFSTTMDDIVSILNEDLLECCDAQP